MYFDCILKLFLQTNDGKLLKQNLFAKDRSLEIMANKEVHFQIIRTITSVLFYYVGMTGRLQIFEPDNMKFLFLT